MMFFGLMGLAALVIDMGFARLAQRQMQTAVDSAALEGIAMARRLTCRNLGPTRQAGVRTATESTGKRHWCQPMCHPTTI